MEVRRSSTRCPSAARLPCARSVLPSVLRPGEQQGEAAPVAAPWAIPSLVVVSVGGQDSAPLHTIAPAGQRCLLCARRGIHGSNFLPAMP